jgi:hypothetical protein
MNVVSREPKEMRRANALPIVMTARGRGQSLAIHGS